jgi:serine/threonine protein kinase
MALATFPGTLIHRFQALDPFRAAGTCLASMPSRMRRPWFPVAALVVLATAGRAFAQPPQNVGRYIGRTVLLSEGRVVREFDSGLPQRFVIEKLLGTGTKVETYLAKSLDSDRRVAVRVSLGKGNDGFDRAHSILNSLSAPQLTRSFGIGTLERSAKDDQSRRVHVMELARGESLSRAGRGDWATGNAVRVVMQVLRGVRALHGVGLRHDDLHLGNVMLVGRDEQTVKVIDIDNARTKGSPIPGGKASTKQYSPGESVPSEGRVNSDVYATASMLTTLLTGKNPRENREQALDALPDVTAEVKGKRVHLSEVIRHGLDPDPSRRYQTAQEFINALRPFAKLD